MVAETSTWWSGVEVSIDSGGLPQLTIEGKTKEGIRETIYINLFCRSNLYDFMDAALCAFDAFKKHRLMQIENQLPKSRDPATDKIERTRLEE